MRWWHWTILAVVALLGGLGALVFEGGLPKEAVDAKYSSPASRFMDLGALGRVHYRDEGRQQGPTVLLVHGSNASLHTFEPWVRLLGDEYRLVSLDLPGHGLTGETPSGDYTQDGFVQVVHEAQARLGLGRMVLVGSSMGGGVVLGYALAHPERVAGLALVGSGGLWAEPEEGAELEPPLIFTLLRQPWFQALAVRLDSGLFLEQGVRSAYNDSPVVDATLLQRYRDLNLRHGTRAATVARFQQPYRAFTEQQLAGIQAPTLIMWGKQDALTPFAVARRFQALLPNTQTAFYDQAGHLPMEEIPQRSAQDLRRFLQGLGRW